MATRWFDGRHSFWDATVMTVLAGLLLALVCMGVVHAREAARRAHCQNNLRQLGLGLQGYHQVYGVLPPVAVRASSDSRLELQNQTSGSEPYSMPVVFMNWAVLLLGHLGHEELANEFDGRLPITDPANARGRTVEVAAMRCPSDRYNRRDNPYSLVTQEAQECRFARGNYAINGGTGGSMDVPGAPWEPIADGMFRTLVAGGAGSIERVWGSGVAGFNKSFAVQEFKNGTSNLVALEEVRAGLAPSDSRGVWALGEIGASATWWHGLFGDCPGPNCRWPRSDDIVGCHQLHEALGEAALVKEGMPCCSYTKVANQATARSMHAGGVHVLLVDGSTKFLADAVDMNVWHALHSRDAQEISVPYRTEAVTPVNRPATSEPISKSEIRRAGDGEKAVLERFVNSVGMSLVPISPGEFIMGLPDEGEDHATPVTGTPADVPPHTVRISRAFCLGACEVTQQQYERVMACNPSWHTTTGGGKVDVIGKDAGRFPVEQVSWADAVRFCEELSSMPEEGAAGRRYRLPSEAEWEYCCRAGSRTAFRVPDRQADDGTGFNVMVSWQQGRPVTEVGSYQPNAFGLYDMRGNVWEWCADWYAWDYYARSPREDPQGPVSGILKVVRGADWRFTGMGCKYGKFHTEPWRTNPYIGFRVVCEAPQ